MPDDELNKALDLARGIIHGPLPGNDAPPAVASGGAGGYRARPQDLRIQLADG